MSRLFVTAFVLFVSFTSFGQSFTTTSYVAGSGISKIIQADFNGDGIPDLATANSSSNTVSILINNGDGTFRPHLEFATGPEPTSLVAVDLNKDGKMDLVVLNSAADATHNISILIGNGDGTFQPHRDIGGGPNIVSVAAGDFNHDGNPDIATASASPQNAVFVNLGNGAGGFIGQKTTTGFGQQPQPGEHPYSVSKIAVADYNRDGKDDLYFTQVGGGFDVEVGAYGVLASNGDGTFSNPFTRQLSVPVDLYTTDINQDGLSDFVMTYAGCHTPCDGVTVAINLGNGSFGFGTNIDVDTIIPGGASFDVNGDGLKDLVLVSTDENFANTILFISRRHVDGSWDSQQQTTAVTLPAPPVGGSVATGDFNHDGKIDLAFAAGNTVYVVLNTTPTAACNVSTLDHTVTVCHPEDGAVGGSPTHIVSHATSSTPVDATQIYLDFKLVFQVSGGTLDTMLPMNPGAHRVEVKSWTQGRSFRNDFMVSTIAAGTGGGIPECTDTTNFTVHVCSPGANSNVSSPVHVAAAAASTAKITAMQIYVDGKLVFNTPNVSQISTDVPMAKGLHTLIVKAWDSAGRSFKDTRSITVQ